MNFVHKTRTLCICMILALLFFCSQGRAEIVDRIVANVDGKIILYSDLQHQVALLQKQMPTMDLSDPAQKSKVEHEVLQQMVAQKLADIEAKRLKITVDDSEVQARLKQLMEMNHLTMQQLKQRLEADGDSLKSVREKIKNSIARQELVERVLKSKVVITDKEVDDYLKDHGEQAGASSNQIRLALIVLPVGGANGTPAQVKKTGTELVRELRGGADFQTLAKHYSKGPAAQQGGDVGYMDRSEVAPFIAKAIEGLKKGQESGLVQGPDGYYIVKIVDVNHKHISSADPALREKVRKMLYEQAMNRKYAEWIKNLESKAFIHISL